MLHPGQTIGGYRIDALLGKGAMGEVYQGEQLSLGRPVAIKRIAEHLLDESDALSRFEREAKCVAALADPHIISVYDFGLFTDADGEGQILLIMELVTGGRSLKQLLTPDEPLSWQEATALVLQVARGLATAHEQGVVHRDIKPDNVLLNVKGIAKLADFGLARGAESTALTAAGNMLGTPNYMSPEACQGEPVNTAADVYSLGATWYHLLAGRPPFKEANLMALVHAHCEKTAQPISEIQPALPIALARLVDRCLAKDASQRPSCAELVTAIASAGGDQLPADLRDLCRRGGMSTDPSTIGTKGVDPEAATLRNGEAATVATANEAQAATVATAHDVGAASAETLPTANPAAATDPTLDEVREHRPMPTWLFIPSMMLVAAVVIAWLFFGSDPLESTGESIDDLLASGEIGTALTTADAFIIMYPSEPGGHELLRKVLVHEAMDLAAQQRYDDALARLQEHRSEYKWLDIAMIERDVRLRQARELAADGQLRMAEAIYLELMERLPRDIDTRQQALEQLSRGNGMEATHGQQRAAGDLLQLQSAEEREPLVYEVLLRLLFRRSVDSEETIRVRAALLQHYRQATVARGQEVLTSERDSERRHALQLLREAGVLRPEQELAYHMRNLCELSSAMRSRHQEAMEYLLAHCDEADWHQRLAAAGYGRIEEIRAFNSWSEFHDELRAACLRALAPELRPWARSLIELRDEAAHPQWRARWHAYLFLRDSDGLEGLDLDAFHRTSITGFEPWYYERCFIVGRDYFAAKLEGPEKAGARAALEAARAHILDARKRTVANGNATDIIDENLASVEAILAKHHP